MRKHKINTAVFLIVSAALLAAIGLSVFIIDPYFHYRKPDTDRWYYDLSSDDERFQNNGILRHFDYDAIITGTSMTQCFHTSDLDELFGTHSVKVSYSASTIKETSDQIYPMLKQDRGIRIVVRDLQPEKILYGKDVLAYPAESYPDYLYDENPLNDVNYLLNRNTFFEKILPMTNSDKEPGITSFDDYSNWSDSVDYGVGVVQPLKVKKKIKEGTSISEERKDEIRANIRQNITSLAEEFPDVDFYVFIPPYSIVWWQTHIYDGYIRKVYEGEEIAFEEMLKYDNIKLFSFTMKTDITTDLNNYRDYIHYGEWVNWMILDCMKKGDGLLTADNYQQYMEKEKEFYFNYDYSTIKDQIDYEDDGMAAVVMDEIVTGKPAYKPLEDKENIELSNAKIGKKGYDGHLGLRCKGRLDRAVQDNDSLSAYLYEEDYIGVRFSIDDAGEYRHLSFMGKRNKAHGMPTVCIYDEEGNCVLDYMVYYDRLDHDWHHYTVSLYGIEGPVTVILNGGYIDSSGNEGSAFTFSEIALS